MGGGGFLNLSNLQFHKNAMGGSKKLSNLGDNCLPFN